MITHAGSSELPSALLQQPDGKLVAAGSFSARDATDNLLARYEALGCPAADPEPYLAQLETFVTDVYLAAFARQPSASEVAYWVDLLATEPTPDTVRGMLHVVFDGPEFRQRPVNPWQYVEALYQAILGRDPAPAELDWWVQAVLDHFNMLLPEFIDSPEFQHLVPDCQDLGAVTLLVGRLYQQVLKRVPSWDEVVWWTADIVTWCALQDAVEFFFNSLEYLSVPRTLADHVTVLYRGLLAREPDAGGLAWWMDDLAGQLTTPEDAVMASPEFEAHVYRLFPSPDVAYRRRDGPTRPTDGRAATWWSFALPPANRPKRHERPRPYGRRLPEGSDQKWPIFRRIVAIPRYGQSAREVTGN